MIHLLTLCVAAASALNVGFSDIPDLNDNRGVKANVDVTQVQGTFFFGFTFENDQVAGIRTFADGYSAAVAGSRADCLGDDIVGNCQRGDFGDKQFSFTVNRPGDGNTVVFSNGGPTLKVSDYKIGKPVLHQINLDKTCSNKGKADSNFNFYWLKDGKEEGPQLLLEEGKDFPGDVECENFAMSLNFDKNLLHFFADYALAHPPK